VGNSAIPRAVEREGLPNGHRWVLNDLDPRWPGVFHQDARLKGVWEDMTRLSDIDWTVSNPAFTPALEIIDRALEFSRVGVAMHLRASIHEVLKTGVRRTWMSENTPTGILWLPRFAYQRSKKTGQWTTDSVCACWVIWLADAPFRGQFIEYAPTWVLEDLEKETPVYRERMDALMGYAGTEAERQQQRVAA
jgi:hypothetical protein